MSCTLCGGKGLIKVNYHDGAPFDVAICDCRAGRAYRTAGTDLIRRQLGIPSPEHQIAYREAFEDEAPVRQADDAAFIAAGRTAKKAKL